DLSRNSSSISPSSSRKRSSPSRRKISGTERPWLATIMSSVSTKQRPRRRASKRPHTDLPAPMNPTSTMLSRRTTSIVTLLFARERNGRERRSADAARRMDVRRSRRQGSLRGDAGSPLSQTKVTPPPNKRGARFSQPPRGSPGERDDAGRQQRI